MTPALIISYIIALIAIRAVGDGLNSTGVSTWGHLLNAIETAGLIMITSVFGLGSSDALILLASYIMIRVGLFDYIYNIAAGNPLSYMGGKNWWDMFFVKFPPHGVLFAKIIFLIAGIATPIKYL